MKNQGRGVIRLNDKTDHGGPVISATSETIVMGKAAAIQDDMTFCPACKGKFALKPDGAGAKHKSKPHAGEAGATSCSLEPTEQCLKPRKAISTI